MSALLTRSIAACLAVALPAASHASCWRDETVRAAMVRDLDTMLMVGALRCRDDAAAYHHAYNGFVIQSRGALIEANEMLKRHFRDDAGPVGALAAYDRYTVKVANRYGAGAEGLACLDLASIVEAAASEAPHFDALAALAERAAVEPLIEGEPCAFVTRSPAVMPTLAREPASQALVVIID